MSFFAQDTSYWNNKVKNFLHDPPDKALQIPGHERRSNLLLDALGISATLQAEDYSDADRIAAGMDRVVLPGYSADAKKNGAVDFLKNPVITHPLGNNEALSINLPENLQEGGKSAKIEDIAAAMQKLLRDDLGVKVDGQGLSEKPGLKGDEKAFAPMRFHYLHFLFKKRLAAKNIGGLGALWPRLPADTRLPDHSIWQHNSLVSALASCTELSPDHQAAIMVFSLTPVQEFIAKSRKLRDFWSGSLILSWLAFEGIKVVISELGADHVLYPSLHDQPMVEDLLGQLGMDDLLDEGKRAAGRKPGKNGVASFPNKFVFLVPKGREAEVAEKISSAIKAAWMNLGERILALIFKKTKKEDPFINTLFAQQMGEYWDFQWAASPLVGKSNKEIVTTLLHEDSWKPAFDLLKEAEKFFRLHEDGKGSLYSVSHALAQGCLAAGKLSRTNHRVPEAGIKCDMFSEYEIIHYHHKTPDDQNPPPSRDPFWLDLREAWGASTDFKKTERLCAIGLVKRLAYRVCQEIDDHPLRPFFKNADGFPSTTEIALHYWYRSLVEKAKTDEPTAGLLADLLGKDKKREALPSLLAQCWHNRDEPQTVERQGYDITDTSLVNKTTAQKIFTTHPVHDYQKYYALLLMDGDRLGKLVNGEALGATWKSVLAPELQKRLEGNFETKHKKFWEKFFAKRRLVAPSTHAAISEALGDFSLHTVPAIINKYDGQLIYAGGDDVCAIMPVATVVDAAREISSYYGAGFVSLNGSNGGSGEVLTSNWQLSSDRLAIHPGRGDQISISAGILVAHHKKPLSGVLRRSHELLELAKNQGGRNAFALELDKRSGGGRIMLGQWSALPDIRLALTKNLAETTLLEHFQLVGDSLAGIEEGGMSSSLAYRIETFRPGLAAIMAKNASLLPAFIEQQLQRSGDSGTDEDCKLLAQSVAALLARMDHKNLPLPIESLIVAKFIGLCRRQRLNLPEEV